MAGRRRRPRLPVPGGHERRRRRALSLPRPRRDPCPTDGVRLSGASPARRYRGGRGRPPRPLAHAALSIAHPRLPVYLRKWWHGKEPRRRHWLIDPAFARRAKPLPEVVFRPIGVRRTQARLLRIGHLGQCIEGWAASGARRGIEYRYPLLDRRLLEFALGLPPEQFRRGRWSRWLMRHALGAVLPPEICWNPDKADPARLDPLFDTFAETMPALRRTLTARAAPPSRACYIDMPRLLERLDAGRSSLFMSTWKPLQLLDF